MGYHFSVKLIALIKKKYMYSPKAHLKISAIMIAFILNTLRQRKSYQFFSQYIFSFNIKLIDVLYINDNLLHRPEK